MKQSLLIPFFLAFLVFNGTAQEIKITTEDAKEVNSFAASVENIETFFNAKPLPIYIRLFECGRSIVPLSEGPDVILIDFYISVKEATETNAMGELGYFWVSGHFIDPKNYKFDPERQTLTFEHGTEEYTETTTLKISFEEINVE